MPENDMDDIERTLREIREAWAAKLPERLDEIRAALGQCEAAPGQRACCQRLGDRLHTLSGSAGSFGFADLGMRATELELRLNAYLSGDADDFTSIAAGVRQMLDWAARHKE